MYCASGILCSFYHRMKTVLKHTHMHLNEIVFSTTEFCKIQRKIRLHSLGKCNVFYSCNTGAIIRVTAILLGC